jgi:metal-sulfur cluster biosynthetic enzyme
MNKSDIAHILRHVPDPELGMDIVTLGLIYGIDYDENAIRIRMTTTSPSCPMGEAIWEMVDRALTYSYPEHAIEVEMVNDPPWNPAMADREALVRLGLIPAA